MGAQDFFSKRSEMLGEPTSDNNNRKLYKNNRQESKLKECNNRTSVIVLDGFVYREIRIKENVKVSLKTNYKKQ